MVEAENIRTRTRVIRCTEADAFCGPWRAITPEEEEFQFPRGHRVTRKQEGGMIEIVPVRIYGQGEQAKQGNPR